MNHSDPEGYVVGVRVDVGGFRIAFGHHREWNLTADTAATNSGDSSLDFGVRYKAGKNNFSIGYMHVDLTGKASQEIEEIIRAQHYDSEVSVLDYFRKFLSLEPGDHVAVNNAIHGLFGIGVVNAPYRYEDRRHDTGAEAQDEFYSHLIGVDWKVTRYMKRKDLLQEGEAAWVPYGTVGALVDPVPDYILRALGKMPSTPQPSEIEYVQPVHQ